MLLSRISLLFFWTSVFVFATMLVVTVLDADFEATFDSFFLLWSADVGGFLSFSIEPCSAFATEI